MSETVAKDLEGLEAPARQRGILMQAFRSKPTAILGAVVLVAFILAAVFAGQIAPYGEHEQVGEIFGRPDGDHLLGLDDAGFDMFSLLLYGARVSLIVGFVAAAVAMLIGGSLGVISGFFGGKVDTVIMRITDYFLAIPDTPLMIVVSAVWGRSLRNIILIIGLIYWPSTARLIRAQVKSIRERVYIKRTRALGASNTRLIRKHVVPQIAPLLVANTVLMVALAIFLETAISFLGLGDPSLTSWGKLIENAFSRSAITYGAWWAIVPPGIAVTIVIAACTMVGTSLEDALNPRLRVSHLSVKRFRMRPLVGRSKDAL